MMRLPDVRAFVEILGSGSFTAAAKALGLPKSSLARQLARLEEELGCVLIRRTTRTIELTEEGRRFLPHARRLLDDSIEALTVIKGSNARARGQVTVSAPATFGRLFLAPRIPEFRRSHPHVRLALRLGASKAAVGVGDVDVAIRLGPLVEPDLAVRRLGQIEFCLVAAPAYLRARPAIAEPIDLARHELIELRPPAQDNRLDLVREGKRTSVRCVPGIELNDPDAAKLAALADGGIATLPSFLVTTEIEQGRLVRVLPEWSPNPAPISVLFAAHIAPPLRIRAYVDYLFETLAKELPWTQ